MQLRLVEPNGYTVPGGIRTATADTEAQARKDLKALAVEHAALWADFGYHANDYRVLTQENHMPDQTDEKPEKKATITLDVTGNDPKFPAYQLSINAMDGENSGHGYRLMGPKYLGRSKNLRTVELDQRDADKIRGILNEAFPQETDAEAGAKRRLEDGSTHTVQALTEAGESCVQQECTAAREEKRLRQELYTLRAAIEGVLDEVRDMGDDDQITAKAADQLRQRLRDALGLDTPIS